MGFLSMGQTRPLHYQKMIGGATDIMAGEVRLE